MICLGSGDGVVDVAGHSCPLSQRALFALGVGELLPGVDQFGEESFAFLGFAGERAIGQPDEQGDAGADERADHPAHAEAEVQA